MEKFFNTAGPVNRPQHYKIDPLHRWNLDEILMYIQQEKYFVLHAPRQTGKTSSLLALKEYLNAEGAYVCVYANFEAAQAARNDVKSGLQAIITELSLRFSDFFPGINLSDEIYAIFNAAKAESGLNAVLTYLSEELKKPLVLLIDEIDALVGDTLVSVLRQIRGGYDRRPAEFPSTIVLCGVRDIKDYRINRSNEDIITGGSAFNIKAESLRLGNFTQDDIVTLYNEHTAATGQKFEPECFDLIWQYTAGQPWLVNALAYEVTMKMKENRDRAVTIIPEMIEEAKERLILSRQTHLDQLADKLAEDRVRRVILPMILGEEAQAQEDDKQYCMDLGLITKSSQGIVISNAIYREVIPRELSKEHQDNLQSRFSPEWVNPDGSINTDTLFTMFQDFWRENAGIWASHIKGYQEAAPQLVTQAYLQRVANGNGSIAREYAILRKRTDLMLKWNYREGEKEKHQKIVIELKTINEKQSYEKIISEALKQTAEYTKICGADESHILIFDRDETRGWRKTAFKDHAEHEGISITIWGM